MNTPPVSVQSLYAEIVDALQHEPGVRNGRQDGSPSRSAFGVSALRVNNKIFALLSSRGQFVVKLPRRRVDALVSAGDGERFDPGHGRLMKEWVAMEPATHEEWLSLAREAMVFVGTRQ